MKSYEPVPDYFPVPPEKEGLNIDYRRIFFRALRRWYFVVLSLAIALTLAFLRNRYAERIYPVNASIVIKESQETGGGGELLYNNALIQPYRNYYNELYIIRSYPLIQSVLEDVNFGVQFFREGNILTSELYNFPVTVSVLNKEQMKRCSFNFQLLSDTSFQLQPNQENPAAPEKFSLNDTILYQGLMAVFSLKPGTNARSEIHSPVVFQYTAPEWITGGYVGRLGARWAEQGSGVIILSITGLNPQKEIAFLNGLIKRYQEHDLENKNAMATRTVEFISEQLGDISDSLQQVEGNLQRFKGENILTDLSSETNRVYTQMESVELERTEIIYRKNYYDYLTKYVSQDGNLDQVIMPSSVGLQDPVLSRFIEEMITIQMNLKLSVQAENNSNPLVRRQKERLEEIRRNVVELVRNQQATDKIREEFLDRRIRTLEDQLAGYPAAERRYVSIRRNYSLLENLYIFLLQKRAEASISKASSISDISIVNPPMAGGAISPRPAKNYTIAGLVGLAFPIGIFILLELLNTRIQSKEDVEKITSVPFIGGVGHKSSPDNKAVLASPKSAVSESFRALRSNLTYFLSDKQKIVVLITSSVSGEGKTFTTINLATVMALSGKRTLIVGADMRKPKLYGDFNLKNDTGLSSYLAGLKSFDDVIQQTGEANMDLVSGGPVPPNPSELVLNERMHQFFNEAKRRYDFVIVDSPPLAIVADAFVLNDHVDHMIYVIRQDYTPKQFLKSLDEHYKSGRVKNISLLLNDIFKSGPGYGYNYGYGYGYGYGKRKNGDGYYS